MAKASIKSNYIFNLAYQLVAVLAPLVTTPYLARVLGPDGVGLVSYVESIVAYFTMFAVLGTGRYGKREMSYLQEDRAGRSRTFWNIVVLRLAMTAISAAAYIPFALSRGEDAPVYLIFGLSLVSVPLDVTWFFQGMEEFRVIAVRNIAVKVVWVVLVFALVHDRGDLHVYVLGMTSLSLVGCASVWPVLRRAVGRPIAKQIRPFDDLGLVLSLFAPTVAVSVYTVLDKTMIGVITADAFENGYYAQAIKISKLALTVVTSLGVVMASRIGSLFASGDRAGVREYMYRSYRFVWFLGTPLCLGLVAVAPSFVPWFFGPGYDKVIPLLQVTSFLVLAIGISNVTGDQYLVPTKRQRLYTATVVMGAAINFALNMALIPSLLSVGAAISSVVAEVSIAAAQIALVRKELRPSRILALGSTYFVAGAVMLAVLLAAGSLMAPSLFSTMALVLLGALVYVAVLLIAKDEFFLGHIIPSIARR